MTHSETYKQLEKAREAMSIAIMEHMKLEYGQNWHKLLLTAAGDLDVCLDRLNKRILELNKQEEKQNGTNTT